MEKTLCAFLLVASASIFAVQARAQVIVIVNSSVKSTDASKSEIYDVFTGANSSLKDGTHVAPVLLKAGAAHEAFLAAYVGKNDSAFQSSWRSLAFSGKAVMPKSMASEADVVAYVAHTTGAIGYISNATPHDGVKVLNVK
jgi:ABC-type phosphate transport system substrate-binding protein